MTERKKVSILSLYQREKKITIEDDAGNFSEVLLVKLTQGQRAELLKAYNEYLEEERSRVRAREEHFHTLALTISRSNKNELTDGIVAFERTQRAEIADLYPAVEGKSEEEKKILIEAELQKFATTKKEELLKLSEEELKKQFLDLTIEAQALIEAARILNLSSLVYMCLDPESRQQIFKDIADIERIADRRVIDRLVSEMNEFRAAETAKEVRSIASSDESFLPAGESQKSLADSPVITA